ncbi:MAG: hypothetical protein ACD_9C00040G0003 [uncultured bacterium]|nr:MAG: hypothetical protein ACD_9C00040G0003 [uncultured bacterium]
MIEKINLFNVTLMGIDCVDVERIQKALDISESNITFAQVKLLTSLPTNDARKIEIPAINSIEEFSEFCIKDLHKYVQTEYVLLVQYDGFILNPASWEDEFLKYDYIGAPWLVADWSVRDYDFPKNLLGKRVVGNGGFSLRSKKFLETTSKLASEGAIKKYHPEDVVLCVFNRKKIESMGIEFAPAEVASRFSIEGDDDEFEKQFGFHGLKWTDISKWIKENPQWGIKQITNE